MEIKERMYVRTKDGRIGKVVDVFSMIMDVDLDQKEKRYVLDSSNVYCYCEEDIKKSSHNIMDLIEIGDYVNGEKVMLNNDGNIKIGTTRDNIVFNNEKFIKTIVTKEQFESMSYKVGEVCIG